MSQKSIGQKLANSDTIKIVEGTFYNRKDVRGVSDSVDTSFDRQTLYNLIKR